MATDRQLAQGSHAIDRRRNSLCHAQHPNEPYQKKKECAALIDYTFSQGKADDKALVAARLVFHDGFGKRKRRESHGRERVHDQLNPKHRRDDQMGFCTMEPENQCRFGGVPDVVV